MLRRHASGTSIILIVLLAGALGAGAAWYVTDRPNEYRADATVAVVPVERLDDTEMIDAYAALASGSAVDTLAESVERQERATLDDGDLSIGVADDSSMIVATGTGEATVVAEGIANDAVTALGASDLLRGPFELEDVTGAAGTATQVEPPWGRWALVAGAVVLGLILLQQLIARGLRRRHLRLDNRVEPEQSISVDEPSAPVMPAATSNGNGNGSNGAGYPLEELSPITWSAPPA